MNGIATQPNVYPQGTAPMVSRFPREMLNSTDFELVRKIVSEYSNAWQANSYEYKNIIKAWRFFFGAPEEQWEKEEREYKKGHDQRIAQYNIIKQKVQVFAGMLIADEYDFKYDPVTGARTSGIEGIENAYYCDKEICNYDYHYGLVIEDGVIHVGILEIKITKEFDYRGNICFVRAIPGRWVTDPYWKSDDDKDCLKAWKQGHMTIKQLQEAFKKLPSSTRFDAEKQRIERMGMEWTSPDINEYNTAFPTFRNAFHVIEAHWVEIIDKKRLVAKNVLGDWISFPVTNDNEKLEAFAQENMIMDYKEGESEVVPYKDRIHHSAQICPELWPYKLLDKGKPEVQIKGLPIIQFTCKRDIAGRNVGKVNDLINPQEDYNYAQSKIWEILANQLGGGLVYEKRLMPDESDQEEFEKHHNDATRAWGIDGDPRKFSAHLTDAQINPELIRKTGEAYEEAEKISGVSAAMSAEAKSGEPASLYAMRLKVNKIGTLTIDKRVRHFRERMQEAYFNQSKITYAGPERKFTSKDGKKVSVLNQDIGDGQIRNKVEDLPRVSVTITESPNNLTKQMRDRAELQAVLESMPPEFREAIAIAYGELFQTTSIGEDKKQSIAEALTLEAIKARLENIAAITNNEAMAKQGQLMSLQVGAQIEKVIGMLGQMQPQPQEVQDMVSQAPPEQEATTVAPEMGEQPTEQIPMQENIQEPI